MLHLSCSPLACTWSVEAPIRRALLADARSAFRRPAGSRAFTLVELLVVVTIIGILAALLLPAVQVAREAARIGQCRNNLKQLALGCLQHESATGRFPTDGWGDGWTGDADLGTDRRQPGGWIFNVLPYIEQQAVHDLGAGLPADAKYAANLLRLSIPLRLLYCPTRRNAAPYPWGFAWLQPANASAVPTMVCKNDYAANGGDAVATCYYPHIPLWKSWHSDTDAGPASLADGGVNGTPEQTATRTRHICERGQRGHWRGVLWQPHPPARYHGRDEQYVSCRREIPHPGVLYGRLGGGKRLFRVQRRLR